MLRAPAFVLLACEPLWRDTRDVPSVAIVVSAAIHDTSYASSQAHSSVKKAAMIAGLPMANFRTIKASKSSGFAMDPAELESQIDDDLEAGLFPAVCVATLGTTGIAAVDPLGPVGRVRE